MTHLKTSGLNTLGIDLSTIWVAVCLFFLSKFIFYNFEPEAAFYTECFSGLAVLAMDMLAK